MNSNLIDKLTGFSPISLKEMDKVAFYHRVDTKFVFHEDQLESLFMAINNDYFILEMDNKRCFSYSTIYYDTPETKMYLEHIRGKRNRYKLRHRQYNDSGLSFIEVKFKNNKGKTFKWRNEEAFPDGGTTTLSNPVISKRLPYNADNLLPVLKTKFSRITLVDKHFTQRVTIDSGIKFKELLNGQKTESLSNIIIIEIKSDKINSKNGIQKTLKKHKINAGGFSKYCMGVALTNTCTKKSGALKPKILRIHKIQKNAVKHSLLYSE